MYTWRNPNDVNAALGKTGSQFRVDENGMQPTTAPAPAPQVDVQTAQPAPAQQAPVTQDPLPPNPYDGPEEPEKKADMGGWNDLGGTISAMGDKQDAKQAQSMQKLGTLVGTVLSFYTGNYQGGAQGIKSMSDQNKAK